MAKVLDRMLTTKDNPYDPFTQFDQWLAFDEQKGYYTCEYLARLCKTSDELSTVDHDTLVYATMDEIVANDPTQNYIQVEGLIDFESELDNNE